MSKETKKCVVGTNDAPLRWHTARITNDCEIFMQKDFQRTEKITYQCHEQC